MFEDRKGLPSTAELDGTSSHPAERVDARQASAGQAGPSGRRKPVWDDPDDAHARVNVSGRNRLRKLRVHEAEAVLTGEHAGLHQLSLPAEGCSALSVEAVSKVEYKLQLDFEVMFPRTVRACVHGCNT